MARQFPDFARTRRKFRTPYATREYALEHMPMESFLSHARNAALMVFGFAGACSIPISSGITSGPFRRSLRRLSRAPAIEFGSLSLAGPRCLGHCVLRHRI
jgi:hypothetical protein